MVLFLTLVPVIILSRDFSIVKISIEYEMTIGEVAIPHRLLLSAPGMICDDESLEKEKSLLEQDENIDFIKAECLSQRSLLSARGFGLLVFIAAMLSTILYMSPLPSVFGIFPWNLAEQIWICISIVFLMMAGVIPIIEGEINYSDALHCKSDMEALSMPQASLTQLCPDGFRNLRGNAVISGSFFLSSLLPLCVLLWLTRRQKQAQIM